MNTYRPGSNRARLMNLFTTFETVNSHHVAHALNIHPRCASAMLGEFVGYGILQVRPYTFTRRDRLRVAYTLVQA